MINKEIDYTVRTDLEMRNLNYENVWIEINNDNKTLGCIYRHPASNINEFTQSLETNRE